MHEDLDKPLLILSRFNQLNIVLVMIIAEINITYFQCHRCDLCSLFHLRKTFKDNITGFIFHVTLALLLLCIIKETFVRVIKLQFKLVSDTIYDLHCTLN